MKRSGFAQAFEPRLAREWTATELPGPRVPAQPLRIEDGKARMTISLPKNPPKRSEPYRRWVASRPCEHCQRAGPSQCAHADEGKGMAMKASDEHTFALCADGPGRAGCHSMIGAAALFTRNHRRALERRYVERTQMAAKSCGQWPKDWPLPDRACEQQNGVHHEPL